MKNTKQAIALASAAALSVGMLAGCGGTGMGEYTLAEAGHPTARKTEDRVDTEALRQFGDETAAVVFTGERNEVYSPVSLYVARGMLTELADDELLECTPKSLRIRKRELDHAARMRNLMKKRAQDNA